MTPVDAMIKISEVLMVLLLILGIAFGSPIVIILALFGMHEDGAAADWEASERNKERRHKEYMDEVKENITEQNDISEEILAIVQEIATINK